MLGKQQTTQLAIEPASEPDPWLARVLKRQIIVHTRSDQSIEGVLMEQSPDGLILRAAYLLEDNGRKTSIAGETWVPRGNVSFAQLAE
jgi:hypothetical protein